MENHQPPLHIQPGVSRRLVAFLVVTHGLGAGVVLLMPGMPWWGRLLLLLGVGVSGWHYWRLHISRQHPAAVLETTFYGVDSWRVQTRSDSQFAVLADSSFLQPWLCVLNLRMQSGAMHSLILLPDNTPADVLRRLRVRVKFSATDLPEK